MSSASPSATLVEEVVAKFGTPTKAAEALGVTFQHISRVRQGRGGLGIVATVKAAILTGRDPARALRDADEGDAADVLLNGFGGGGGVSRTQRKVLDQLDAISPAARRHILGLLDILPGK